MKPHIRIEGKETEKRAAKIFGEAFRPTEENAHYLGEEMDLEGYADESGTEHIRVFHRQEETEEAEEEDVWEVLDYRDEEFPLELALPQDDSDSLSD